MDVEQVLEKVEAATCGQGEADLLRKWLNWPQQMADAGWDFVGGQWVRKGVKLQKRNADNYRLWGQVPQEPGF